jgi:hypothetical protein
MTDDSPGAVPEPSPHIDTTVPHSARIWNYWLGGTDNYPVDRAAGDEYRAVYPQIVDVARASRAFQVRAVRFLAAEAGLRQFLDVGAGLPAVENTHETAQAIAAGLTEPVTEPGYPEPESFPVRRCLQAILNEEWEQRLYAERDLDVLASPSP